MVGRRLSQVAHSPPPTSSSQTVASRPTAPAAGMSAGDAPPIAAATASALASPDDQPHLAGELNGGQVKVIRRGGGFESSTPTTRRSVSSTAGSAGNSGIDVAFTAHPEEVDVENRRGVSGFGVRRGTPVVGLYGGHQVVSETPSLGAIGGCFRTECRRGPVRPRGPASRCARHRRGDEALVAPEQMNLGPVQAAAVLGDMSKGQFGAPTGQHDQGPAPGPRYASVMALTRRSPAAVTRAAVNVGFDRHAHTYRTCAMPASAS